VKRKKRKKRKRRRKVDSLAKRTRAKTRRRTSLRRKKMVSLALCLEAKRNKRNRSASRISLQPMDVLPPPLYLGLRNLPNLLVYTELRRLRLLHLGSPTIMPGILFMLSEPFTG
jgi:hypothetical protein